MEDDKLGIRCVKMDFAFYFHAAVVSFVLKVMSDGRNHSHPLVQCNSMF